LFKFVFESNSITSLFGQKKSQQRRGSLYAWKIARTCYCTKVHKKKQREGKTYIGQYNVASTLATPARAVCLVGIEHHVVVVTQA